MQLDTPTKMLDRYDLLDCKRNVEGLTPQENSELAYLAMYRGQLELMLAQVNQMAYTYNLIWEGGC